MLNPRELLEIQVETLFRCATDGRLIEVNEPGNRPAPRVFIGTTITGERIIRVRSDAPGHFIERLHSCADDNALAILLEGAPTSHRGPAYAFPEPVRAPGEVMPVTDPLLLHPELASWAVDIQKGIPLFGVMRDGQVVSICYSSREGSRASEAGVETAPDWRGRGLARLAVLAWAAGVQASGRMAFYSTTHENSASQRIAASLGLLHYAEDWSLE